MSLLKRGALAILRTAGQTIVGLATVALIAAGIAYGNYTATQGAGTSFASVVIGGVHYMANLICDATAGQSQCASVDSSGRLITSGASNVLNFNLNGAKTSANSSPVVIASDQSAIPVIPGVGTEAAPGLGASTSGAIVPNNTTAVVLKASAGALYGVQLYGLATSPAYLKLYNATSATCGSGTPVKRLMIPAAATAANGAGSNITFGPAGILFTVGITYCVTTGIADADTGAPAASTFLVNLDWF